MAAAMATRMSEAADRMTRSFRAYPGTHFRDGRRDFARDVDMDAGTGPA
jgi:hypothetical protein